MEYTTGAYNSEISAPVHVVNLEAITSATLHHEPYRHFIGSNALNAAAEAMARDFPPIDETGFFPVGDLLITGVFHDLIADVNDPGFSTAVGDKLGLDLVNRPRLVTLRHRSAASDGRIHTDSVSKVATVLIYLNDCWLDSRAGCLRVLRSSRDIEDYSAEISPVLGRVFGFRRTENSWHGHPPFAGERKVLQIAWLTDEAKVAHKTRAANFSRWLKRLNPFA